MKAFPAPSPKPGEAPPSESKANDVVPVGEPTKSRDLRVFWVAVVGGFLAVVALVMLFGQWRQAKEEPWRSAELAAAKARLLADPKNEALKTPVRELDRELRVRYFRSLERNRTGAWLLLGGGISLVVMGRLWYAPIRSPKPWVAPSRDETQNKTATALLGVAGVVGVSMALMGWIFRVELPVREAPGTGAMAGGPEGGKAIASGDAGAAAAKAVEEWSLQWPGFRGLGGGGRVEARSIPERWDLAKGQGVVWKTALSLKGYSSPVVWKDRVFLTGGSREQRLVFALDGVTGSEVWRRSITPTNMPALVLEPPDQSGPAASSPATDGERVYAIFATGELGALDYEGRLVWSHRLDLSENGYGHASSLVVWNGILLVQADQGTPEDGKSALHAYDARTGKLRWSAKRPVGGSWASPVVFEFGENVQVVTSGDPWLMGHDLQTGRELWRAKVLGGELAPSPVFSDGRIVATSPGHALSVVKVDGTGDISQSGLVWRMESEVPDVPSPVVVGDLLFTANTEGHVFCRELGSGAKIWDHAFEVEIQASPIVVGDRIYLFGQPGNVWVLRAGRAFEVIAAFEMGEDIYATPAVAGHRMYVRTDRHLVCIGDTNAGMKGGMGDGR